MNNYGWTFLAVFAVCLGLQLWLNGRQLHHLHAGPFGPAAGERHAREYGIARTGLNSVGATIEFGLVLAWTLGGGLEAFAGAWRAVYLPEILSGLALVLSVLAVTFLVRVPAAAYGSLMLEPRFGFGRMTAGLFARDAMLRLVLLVGLAMPLVPATLWLMAQAGDLWWLALWAVWLAVEGFREIVQPLAIAPLFNRFSPLADDGLRRRLKALLARAGVADAEITVMDGSRRSSHGNAHIRGVGPRKQVVLLDTLLETVDADEVAAVVAHEVGHMRHHHLLDLMVLKALFAFTGLALLGLCGRDPEFFAGFGLSEPSTPMILSLAMVLTPLGNTISRPLRTAWLRRCEYQADSFAAAHGMGRQLINALDKLQHRNGAAPTSDRLYASFHNGHPLLKARAVRLRGASSPPNVGLESEIR